MIANQIAGFLGVATAVAATDYESISTVNGNGSASTLSFTSIPSTYSHLQIRGIARDGRAVTIDTAYFTFNSNTGANYAYHWLKGDGTSATATAATSQTPSGANAFVVPGTSAGASQFSGQVIDILDYANTNKNKVYRSLSGTDQNGSGGIFFISGAWLQTAAITQIDLTTGTGTAWTTGTSFALYGIK
jgi:hypothetical protein